MAMNEATGSFAARLSHLYGNIRNCFLTLSELDDLGPEFQSKIAADLGIDRHRLLELNRLAANGAEEMERLMEALHIDPVEVRILSPNHFRDMQLNCSHCASKDQCRHDLGAHKAPENFATYCANASEMNALRVQPDLLVD